MPYRDSTDHEIKLVISFTNLNLLKSKKHKENFHNRKPNDKIFLLEIEEKEAFMWEKKFFFKKNDTIVNYSPDLGFNDNIYPLAYSKENNYFKLHQKCFLFDEYKKRVSLFV